MGDPFFQSLVAGFALDVLAIGVIVTDQDARLVYANAAADRLMGEKTGALRSRGGRIFASRLETQNDLQAIISWTCLGKKLVPFGSNYLLAPSVEEGRPDLAICVLPLQASGVARETAQVPCKAMLLVRAIERDCNLEMEAQRLFGLTRTEAKFASSLASGLSLQEAAKAHEVTPSTARSHMKNIFRKTGVCRQSQVAALLRGAQIPIEALRVSASPSGSQPEPVWRTHRRA